MSIINQIEKLNKHGMACQNCEVKMAEIYITLGHGAGAIGYSYCQECSYDLASLILIDCDKLSEDLHASLKEEIYG